MNVSLIIFYIATSSLLQNINPTITAQLNGGNFEQALEFIECNHQQENSSPTTNLADYCADLIYKKVKGDNNNQENNPSANVPNVENNIISNANLGPHNLDFLALENDLAEKFEEKTSEETGKISTLDDSYLSNDDNVIIDLSQEFTKENAQILNAAAEKNTNSTEDHKIITKSKIGQINSDNLVPKMTPEEVQMLQDNGEITEDLGQNDYLELDQDSFVNEENLKSNSDSGINNIDHLVTEALEEDYIKDSVKLTDEIITTDNIDAPILEDNLIIDEVKFSSITQEQVTYDDKLDVLAEDNLIIDEAEISSITQEQVTYDDKLDILAEDGLIIDETKISSISKDPVTHDDKLDALAEDNLIIDEAEVSSITQDLVANNDKLNFTSVESDLIADPTKDISKMANEVVEVDNTDDAAFIDNKNESSNIKKETDLFALDQDEFDIVKLTENKKQYIEEVKVNQIEDINLEDSTKVREELTKTILTIDVIKKAAQEKSTIKAEKPNKISEPDFSFVKISKKPKLSYKTVTPHPLLTYNSTHQLDNISSKAELYQLLFAAIDMNNITILPALSNLININEQVTIAGQSPIIYAVNRGNINIIRKLISLGYPLNLRDDYGNAAIHIAIIQQRVDILTELIIGGADINVVNAVYRRPINLAYDLRNEQIISLLRKVGAIGSRAHNNFR